MEQDSQLQPLILVITADLAHRCLCQMMAIELAKSTVDHLFGCCCRLWKEFVMMIMVKHFLLLKHPVGLSLFGTQLWQYPHLI